MSDNENIFLKSSSLLFIMQENVVIMPIHKPNKKISLGYSLEGKNMNSSQLSFAGMRGKPSNALRHFSIVLTFSKGEFLEVLTEGSKSTFGSV